MILHIQDFTHKTPVNFVVPLSWEIIANDGRAPLLQNAGA